MRKDRGISVPRRGSSDEEDEDEDEDEDKDEDEDEDEDEDSLTASSENVRFEIISWFLRLIFVLVELEKYPRGEHFACRITEGDSRRKTIEAIGCSDGILGGTVDWYGDEGEGGGRSFLRDSSTSFF